MNSITFIKKVNRKGRYTAVEALDSPQDLVISENVFSDNKFVPIKYAAFISDNMIYYGGNLNKALKIYKENLKHG